ncbi:alpha/beta fold hydrolase [Microlunatus soli]|uniref:Pimeloyl-ACP methyl ester carboxylesterase n=1 Tax=Microlunatus soli TaxID=630515 RepID=A0A1H1Y711_9ACTN|nr:alpha/beta hydrolase [Microlunatus soli]SDT17298.1 Pimeloyl-ACP methyl ester carboxylesterase [Microlunatus soli]
MPSVHLPAGPIDYQDSGGTGPAIVFGHGPPMDHRAWRKVIPLLDGYRCIAPTLPMGGHRRPMNAEADLSQRGMATILADFLDALELTDVTLVLNDWGGGQFMINEGRTDRIGRLALVACEAFDNFPPVQLLRVAGAVPGGMWLLVTLMGWRPFRRMRGGYGGMSVRGLPDELLVDWFRPAAADRRIRRDFAKFAAGSPRRSTLRSWAEQWQRFTRPVLVVWADHDPLMPAEHGPRLAAHYPNAELVLIRDSATLVPEDQPEQLAALLADFASGRPVTRQVRNVQDRSD